MFIPFKCYSSTISKRFVMICLLKKLCQFFVRPCTYFLSVIKGTWLPIGSQILDSTNGRPTRTSLIERPPIHWLLTSEAKPTDYSIVSNSWRFHPKSVVLIAVALALRWPSGWQVAVEHNEGRALPAQFGPARWPGRWRVGPIIVVLYQLFPLTAGLLSRLPGREHYSFISFWWHDAQWCSR